MTGLVHGDSATPQPADAEIDDPSGFALPASEDEIEELLYGGSLTQDERLQRLIMLRDEVRGLEAGDVGTESGSLLQQIENAIATIESRSDDIANAVPDASEPADHGETLAPDDDSRLEDSDADDEVLDPAEWEDGDGFDSGRGVG